MDSYAINLYLAAPNGQNRVQKTYRSSTNVEASPATTGNAEYQQVPWFGLKPCEYCSQQEVGHSIDVLE
jgi:hypothetical protein